MMRRERRRRSCAMTPGHRREGGFTLAEMLVGLAVTGIVMAAIFGLLTVSQQSVLQGTNQAEAQQNARAVLARMIDDIRSAGYDPTAAGFDTVINQSATAFTLQNDWNGNGSIETSVTTTLSGVARGEQITYSLSGGTLTRQESQVDGSALPLARIELMTLQYLDAANAVTATAASIRTVVVTLVVAPDTQPAKNPQGRVLVTVSDRARLRNRTN
jgi:prepilin-type N-terminal cleavage/methylation domain-containing protein